MRNIKRLVFIAFVLVVLVIGLFNSKLSTYAIDYIYKRGELKAGAVFKSGDPFVVDFSTGSGQSCGGYVIMPIVVNYNGYPFYATYAINSGKIIDSPKNISKDIFYNINADAFEFKNPGTLPYLEGKNVIWTLRGDDDYIGMYCNIDFVLEGVVYEEPEFELYCDSTEIGENDKVACQVAVEYSNIPDNVEFELASDKFNISDIKTADGWKRTDDNKLKFESDKLPVNDYEDSRVSADIIEFYITPKDKGSIDVEDAVKVTKVAWKDDFAEKELDSDLIEPMKKKEEVEFEIPKTGVETYLILGVIVLVGGYTLYKKLEEKGLFKRL
jgi:hypothetical protein